MSVITFRLDPRIVESLRKYAEKQGISLNNLVNKVLSRFIDWDVYEKNLMVPLPKSLIIKLFDKLSEDEINEIANCISKELINNIILFMQGNFTQEAVIEWLDKRFTKYFETRHIIDKDTTYTFIIRHDLGIKWSIFHKLVFTHIFDVLNKKVDISYNDRLLILKFLK